MKSLIPIDSSEIHLWLAYYDEITSELLHSSYRRLLNATEKEQEPRFYFARDCQRYLITRALVRTVLSRYETIGPIDWIFSTNAYGRPEIANVEASMSRLAFNISHTHSLIVLGITKGCALGVDVENVCARKVSIDIADRYFAPSEVQALAAVEPERQQDRFFEYWTFEESYIIARGMGLSLPLDKFSFQYPGDHAVEIAIDPELRDDPARWRFWQFRPTTEYLVAVCAERVGAQSPKLTVRKVVPTVQEKILAPMFQRTSE